MLAVATVGIGAGTFGPIYLHGADQSVLQAALHNALPANIGLSLDAGTNRITPSQMTSAATSAPRTADGARLFGSPIITTDRPLTAYVGHQPYGADLISRTGICDHLVFAAGTCPTAKGTAAVSTRSAATLGLHVGQHDLVTLPHSSLPVSLTIVGLYKTPNVEAPYWWGLGQGYFGFGFGSSLEPEVDDYVTSQQTALALTARGLAPLLAQMPLDANLITTGNVHPIEASLRSYEDRLRADDDIVASSEVTQPVASADQNEHTTNTVVEVVLGQLILLALLVLFSVAVRTAESREPDVRLAELRGYPFGARAAVALLEPVAVLTAALPLGIVLAWVVAVLLQPSLLPQGGSATLVPLAFGGALLTFAAGVLATVFGARGLVRRPAGAGAVTDRGRTLVAGLALDVAIVVVAVVAFIEVAVSGVSAGRHTDPLAALAPGFLALGLGVAIARAVPLLSWTLVGRTRNSRRVGFSVAVRRLARLSELSRHVVVLAIAIGLAIFAVSGWAVAARNRTEQALFEVGASRVLTVDAKPGVDFLTSVRQADPSGKDAMAVVVENASDGTTVAVDASRLAAVASWPVGLSPQSASQVATELTEAPAPEVLVSGSALRVTADLSTAITPEPQIDATVFDTTYQNASVITLGALQPGSHQYSGSMAGDCSPTCRLVGLSFTWVPPALSSATQITIPVTISGIAEQKSGGAWTPLAAGLARPDDWVATSGSSDLAPSAAGLSVRATVDIYGGSTEIGPNDVATDLPAVLAGGSGPTPALGVGLDGSTINLQPVTTVDSLPGTEVSGAAMVDLSQAERLLSVPMLGTVDQVWLSSNAPSDIEDRLAARGVAVLSSRTATEQDAALASGGISLAYQFFFMASLISAALAIASTAFVLVAAARRRTAEFAALSAVGVRRTVLLEQSIVVAAGVVAGVAAGVLTVSAALPSIPEFVDLPSGPPLQYSLPLGPFGLGVLATVVALVGTVLVTGRLVVGRSSGAAGGEMT
jgi:hypothetical protein